MEKKWIWSINVFAILVLSFGVIFLINELKYGSINLGSFILMVALPMLLSAAILKRKNLARRICIVYFWIIGISAVFAACTKSEIWKLGLIITLIVALMTYYLTRPKIKEQFK